jgi:predicted ATPase/class 3 adenylate cyclase
VTWAACWRMMRSVRPDLPSGTVTFLFTDVEGSTRLLHELGAEAYAEALAEHRRVIREACVSECGVEVDTQGDAFFFAFPEAQGGAAAARTITEALACGPIKVRVGLHTGSPLLTEEGYVGDDVHFAARVASAGHGGQVVLSAATAARVELELTDLGEHRLKDIERAVAIFQLGDGTFPPLKTISNTNLPRPASSFVGREREVEEVHALLQDGARLLTLTGPGGSGKTRLAVEAAAELVPEFKAGVFWVGLAPLRDPALVTETIAQTLGSKNGLQEHIGERELLLLLDNLEQVVEAAPKLAALVEACPNLKLLCTSRELLRVRGEVEYPVLPLAEQEAVTLFCARARLEPTSDISELCRRLDSLPLALELAAARTKVLSPAQILERLSERLDLLKGGHDADPRQQTLRATIEWSYELLSDKERQLFARLSVFAGGCALGAAESVVDADLDTLQSLVEKSLLRFTNERYWMLETIREYATERLDASSEADAMRQRHAEHFLAVAEEAELPLRYDSTEWLDRLDADQANFRVALDQFEALGDTQPVLALAGAIWRYWFLRGHLTEGRRRLERALAADDRPTEARAKALRGAAVVTFNLGDIASARPWAEESLALHRELGDDWGTAISLHILGGQLVEEGHPAQAMPLIEESVQRFHELSDDKWALTATNNLAWAYAELGERDRARGLHEEVLQLARELGDERAEAHSLFELSTFALDEGRPSDADSMLKASLSIFHERGERLWTRIDLSFIAAVLAGEGSVRKATVLLSSAHALQDEIGSRSFVWLEERDEQTLAAVRTQLDQSELAETWKQGQNLALDEAVALALGEAESDA